MNPTNKSLILFILILNIATGLVNSTENIDGYSDLNSNEAKESMIAQQLNEAMKSISEQQHPNEASSLGESLKFFDGKAVWFVQLFFNLVSYSTIIIPCFLFVTLIKRRRYLEKPSHGFYQKAVRLFVEGNNFSSLEEMNSHKTSSSHHSDKSFIQQTISLCLHAIGLLGSYLIWGILQERVMVFEYQSGNPEVPSERFSNSQFLVLSNRVLAFLVAVTANLLLHQPQHRAPVYKYIHSSFSNIMSSWLQYEALKFVSFPVQVLAKSSKIIPVMLMGKVVSRRSYTCFEYITASAISLGIFLFLMSSEDVTQGGGHGAMTSTTMAGVVILVGYLVFDSFTSNWQDDIFTRYKVSSLQMMAGVNFFSVLLTLTSLLEQGTLSLALGFMTRHPLFAFHVFILSLTSAVGQLFIFATISRFGPATFTIIMTFRQGLAILLSCIIYGHQVTVAGGMGVAIVFLALFVRIYHKQTVAKENHRKRSPQALNTSMLLRRDGGSSSSMSNSTLGSVVSMKL